MFALAYFMPLGREMRAICVPKPSVASISTSTSSARTSACYNNFSAFATFRTFIGGFSAYATSRTFIGGSSRFMSTRPDGSDREIKPSEVFVPLDKIDMSFSRSSGPGGQNVNKLNTKAEFRFHVDTAAWIPPPVRQRLKEYNPGRINSEGELVLTSQEHRVQSKNRQECEKKLRIMLAEAYVEPKERQMYTEISEQNKSHRKIEKKKRGDVKDKRRSNNYDDF